MRYIVKFLPVLFVVLAIWVAIGRPYGGFTAFYFLMPVSFSVLIYGVAISRLLRDDFHKKITALFGLGGYLILFSLLLSIFLFGLFAVADRGDYSGSGSNVGSMATSLGFVDDYIVSSQYSIVFGIVALVAAVLTVAMAVFYNQANNYILRMSDSKKYVINRSENIRFKLTVSLPIALLIVGFVVVSIASRGLGGYLFLLESLAIQYWPVSIFIFVIMYLFLSNYKLASRAMFGKAGNYLMIIFCSSVLAGLILFAALMAGRYSSSYYAGTTFGVDFTKYFLYFVILIIALSFLGIAGSVVKFIIDKTKR